VGERQENERRLNLLDKGVAFCALYKDIESAARIRYTDSASLFNPDLLAQPIRKRDSQAIALYLGDAACTLKELITSSPQRNQQREFAVYSLDRS
jgi:hypothetical protein